MHPYHLPSEAEFAEKQVVIASQYNEILSIEANIEQEREQLDKAVSALNEQYRPFSEAIKARIKALIKQEMEELVSLESKRQRSEDDLRAASEEKVAALEAERALLDKKLKNERAFVAPIRRLPSEILGEIFEWFQLMETPWKLTKVCKSWRGVALRTPQLWARIYITYSKKRPWIQHGDKQSSKLPPTPSVRILPTSDSFGQYSHITYDDNSSAARNNPSQVCGSITGLQKALQLSGGVPLSIIIDLPRYDSAYFMHPNETDLEARKKHKREIIELLIPHLPRCRSIVVKDLPPLSDLGDQITTTLENVHLGRLEQLKVGKGVNDTVNSLILVAQKTALQLRHIIIARGEHSLGGSSPVNLQTHYLKHLTYLSIKNCLSLPVEGENAAWSALTNLRDLEFEGQDLTTWSAALVPSLQRLTITKGTVTDLGGVLSNLKFLYLEDVPAPPSNLVILAPSLETLILYGELIDIGKAIEAPKLASLHLYHTGYRQKTLANSMISNIWNSRGGKKGKWLNPRHLQLVVDATDQAVARALKLMDKVETLIIGLKKQRNAGRKVLEDLMVTPRLLKTKGRKETTTGLCPKLERFEVFTLSSTGRPALWTSPEDISHLQNLMTQLQNARPGIVCSLTQNDVVRDKFHPLLDPEDDTDDEPVWMAMLPEMDISHLGSESDD